MSGCRVLSGYAHV